MVSGHLSTFVKWPPAAPDKVINSLIADLINGCVPISDWNDLYVLIFCLVEFCGFLFQFVTGQIGSVVCSYRFSTQFMVGVCRKLFLLKFVFCWVHEGIIHSDNVPNRYFLKATLLNRYIVRSWHLNSVEITSTELIFYTLHHWIDKSILIYQLNMVSRCIVDTQTIIVCQMLYLWTIEILAFLHCLRHCCKYGTIVCNIHVFRMPSNRHTFCLLAPFSRKLNYLNLHYLPFRPAQELLTSLNRPSPYDCLDSPHSDWRYEKDIPYFQGHMRSACK